MMEYITEYIKNWNTENPKPKNDLIFIAEFTEFARNSDFENWKFAGDNGYCGYTAFLSEYPDYIPVSGLGFEFAYSKDFVKVFTDTHNGFWTPEYIDLSGVDAKPLIGVIKEKLNGWAGFE